MASVTLSGGSGSASGNLSGTTPVTTSYAYSIGWSSIPNGSQITGFGEIGAALFISGASGTSALTVAESTRYWPTMSTDSDYALKPLAAAYGVSGLTTVFFSGNPGSVGSGYIRSDETFYTVSYYFSAVAEPAVTFNPPGSRTLFFGTAN